MVNGRSCADDAQAILAANNYRYVVRHKPQDSDSTYASGSWADQSARAFVAAAFPGAPQSRRTGWLTSTLWIHHVMRARSKRRWRLVAAGGIEGEWRWATCR